MPRPENESRDATPERPPIWVDGRQQPRFDLRAWVRVGEAMARRWLVPHLGATSGHLSVLGGQIVAGRFAVNLSWLGKAERYLPSRQSVGETVIVLALRMSEARLILDPAPQAPEPLAYPDLIRARKAAQPAASAAIVSPPAAAPPQRAEVEPTLSAIRAVLRGLPEAEPVVAPPPIVQVIDLPKKDAPTSRFGLLLARSLSHMIAWSTLILALPVGLTQATLFHLNGGDLTDWD
jgi:hypothetical protein